MTEKRHDDASQFIIETGKVDTLDGSSHPDCFRRSSLARCLSPYTILSCLRIKNLKDVSFGIQKHPRILQDVVLIFRKRPEIKSESL